MTKKWSEIRAKLTPETRARAAKIAREIESEMCWSYPVRLKKDDNDTILVSFVDFPAHTFGDDREDALMHAVDALTSVIGGYIKEGRPIPKPSKGRVTVALPAAWCRKVERYVDVRELDDAWFAKAKLIRAKKNAAKRKPASSSPVVFTQEASGVISAHVPGVPVYAQGATKGAAERAIKRTLAAYRKRKAAKKR